MNRELAGRLLIVIGCICLLIKSYIYAEKSNPKKLAFDGFKPSSNSTYSPIKPIKLTISDLGIVLPIIPTDVKNKIWPTTDDGVSFITASGIPGEQGNSIIYGHNWPNLLGKLPQIRPGQTIKVTFNDGSTKTFQVEKTAYVSPSQTAVLSPSSYPLLTIYTCAGFLDTQRFVAAARLQP